MSAKDIKTFGDLSDLDSLNSGSNGDVNPNEPIFILRGQDQLAPIAIQHWIDAAKRENIDPEIIKSAEAQLQRLAKWPVRKRPSDSYDKRLIVHVHEEKIE